MVTSKSFNNIFNIFSDNTKTVSINIIAKFDNLSWPMVFLKYVFSRLSELKDLSLLQDVAGITLNIFLFVFIKLFVKDGGRRCNWKFLLSMSENLMI